MALGVVLSCIALWCQLSISTKLEYFQIILTEKLYAHHHGRGLLWTPTHLYPFYNSFIVYVFVIQQNLLNIKLLSTTFLYGSLVLESTFRLTLSRKRKRLLRPSCSGTHISRFIAMQVRRNDIGGLGMHWSLPIPLPIMMDEKMNWQILLFKALIRPNLF